MNHCPVCKGAIKKQQEKDKRFAKNITAPAKPNVPLSNTCREKVKLALINERIKCSEFEKDIAWMKCEIKLLGITLSPDLLNGVVKIMNENHYNRITSLRLLSNYFGNNKRLLSKKIPKLYATAQWLFAFVFRWHQNRLQPMMK